MYRRDLRDTGYDGLPADMAVADHAVQAAVGPDGRIAYAKNRELTTDLWPASESSTSGRRFSPPRSAFLGTSR